MSSQPPPNAAPKPFPWFTAFLVLATIALSTLVFILSNENRRLRGMLEESFAKIARESINVADAASPLTLTNASGESRVHDFAQHPATLLLIVSTHCPYCDDTLPVWARAIEDAGVPEIPVLCIQTDVTRPDQLKPTPPNLPSAFVQDMRDSWLAKLNAVPATILVGRDSTVLRTWYGQLGKREQTQITDALLHTASGAPGR